MTVGLWQAWLCGELGRCRPLEVAAVRQQPGVRWARVYRVRWRRGGPSGLGRRR